MINQIINTILFIFGVILGEKFSTKSFGVPKKVMFVLEIVVFVLASIYFMNFAMVSSEFLSYPSSFVFGIASITIARGVSSLLGSMSTRIAKKTGIKKDRETMAYSIIRELKIRKFTEKEIETILKRAGIQRKKAEQMVKEYLKK